MDCAFRWPIRWYPFHGMRGMPAEVRREVFAWASRVGFRGTEVSVVHLDLFAMSDADLTGLRDELAAAGLVTAALNPGGFNFVTGTAEENEGKMLRAVEMAHLLGSEVINTTLPGPNSFQNAPPTPEDWGIGGRVSIGGSRMAVEYELEKTAEALRTVADAAAEVDITIALELHQNCYVDSSASALAMLELVDRENVRVNPDMGNVTWTYATPEERFEDAMVKLAPLAAYVHVKNMRRVYAPDLDRASYFPVTVEEGEVDWRFCIQALAAAGYAGWLTFEGDTGYGWDHQRAMERNIRYVNEILAELE
jgi:sugar phosphate isomerase/epimerase